MVALNWCTVMLLCLLVMILTVHVIISACLCAMALRQSKSSPGRDYDETPYSQDPYRTRNSFNISRNNKLPYWCHGNASGFPPPFPPMPWPTHPDIFFPLTFNRNFNDLAANGGYDVNRAGLAVSSDYDITKTAINSGNNLVEKGIQLKEVGIDNGSEEKNVSSNALNYIYEGTLVENGNMPLLVANERAFDPNSRPGFPFGNPPVSYTYVNEVNSHPESYQFDNLLAECDSLNNTSFFEKGQEFLESAYGFDSFELPDPTFTLQKLDSSDLSAMGILGSGQYGMTTEMTNSDQSCLGLSSSSTSEVMVIADDPFDEYLEISGQSSMSTISEPCGTDYDTMLSEQNTMSNRNECSGQPLSPIFLDYSETGNDTVLLLPEQNVWNERDWTYELDVSSSGSQLVEDEQPSLTTTTGLSSIVRDGDITNMLDMATLSSVMFSDRENISPQNQSNSLQKCNLVFESETITYFDGCLNTNESNCILTGNITGLEKRAPSLICNYEELKNNLPNVLTNSKLFQSDVDTLLAESAKEITDSPMELHSSREKPSEFNRFLFFFISKTLILMKKVGYL